VLIRKTKFFEITQQRQAKFLAAFTFINNLKENFRVAENEGSGGSYPLDVGLTCAPLHIRGAKPLLFPTYKWRTLLFKFSYICLVQIPCYFVEKIHKTQKKYVSFISF